MAALSLRARRARRALVALFSAVVAGASLQLIAIGAPPAHAADDPTFNVVDRPADGVTSDALPTVQIDGVAWATAIAGDTVFAGGQFSNARPAGAAPGTNLSARANLLSFNLRTGMLNAGFNPTVNGRIRAMTLSPDKKTLYIAGAFTQVNGANRFRVAAFDTATGALRPWAPAAGGDVFAIAATDNTVYLGGWFGSVGGQPRTRLAAVTASTTAVTGGAVLTWAPTADSTVNTMTLTPDQTRLIIGGIFVNVNGVQSRGLASLDATTATRYYMGANDVIQNSGNTAGIQNLRADQTSVYASAYWFGGTGNFEGMAVLDPMSGAVTSMADCHGDTYDSATIGATVYTVSHHHHCENIGGFPDTNPRTRFQYANAFTKAATTTVKHDNQGYYDFFGQPSPSIVGWFPTMVVGTYTGQGQAGWTLSSTSEYLVQGGEFPSVNGTGQQGLVRFAIPSIAPNKQAPIINAANSVPTLRGISGDTVRVAFPANFDRDDQLLTYKISRGTNQASNGNYVHTTTARSQFWNRPTQVFLDTGLQPNTTYVYNILVSDANGNLSRSANATITTGTNVVDQSAYSQAVTTDGASHYWRLNENPGERTSIDWTGGADLALGTGVANGQPGAVIGSPDTAAAFNGNDSAGGAATTSVEPSSNNFSSELWFKTTTTSGGKLIGFGGSQTGNSGSYDRHLYMDGNGRLSFGVYPGSVKTVRSAGSLNDGKWHHVVTSLSPAGMQLYVDGVLEGANASVTTGQDYPGYWRIGGDNLGGWPDTSASNYFAGTIDDVAVYPAALLSAQVRSHYRASGAAPNASPVAGFTTSCAAAVCTFDASTSSDPDGTIASYAWSFGDQTTGTGVSPDHTYTASGTYTVELTVTDDLGQASSTTLDLTVSIPNQPPVAAFSSTTANLVASFDATDAVDPDGTVASYAWTFGDGSTGTGVSPSHAYTQAGTFQVTLTVTDSDGDTDAVTKPVIVSAANVSPTAAFTDDVTNLTAAFDGCGSADPDGTIASYAWSFGDGSTGTGASPSHTYTEAGTFTVRLTVTDNRGGTGTVTGTVTTTAVPNQAPTARFASQKTDLAVAFDGTGSSDPDGTVATFAWTFGDGTTGTGASPSHTYTQAGTYSVTLTVTDNGGRSDTATAPITVTAAPANQVVARDDFGRTQSRWGTAATGGAWTDSLATAFSTNGGQGLILISRAGSGPTATLNAVSALDTRTTVNISVDKVANGAGTYVTLSSRKAGTNEYRLKVRLMPDGSVRLLTSVVVSGAETTLRESVVTGLTYQANDVLTMSFQVTGSGTTTLAGKIWKASATEPTAHQITSTNTAAGLQSAGAVAIQGYLSGSATNAPVSVKIDNYLVMRLN